MLASAVAVSACAGAGSRTGELVEAVHTLHLGADAPVLLAAAQAAEAPDVYMDIQYDGSGPASVIFAVDHSRDGTPSDDPAIRLTPEFGKCNPQILRSYSFPQEVEQPVYSQNVALLESVPMWDVPELMAVEVTAEMMRRGLIARPDDSRPQNICARKLWFVLIATEDFAPRATPAEPPPGPLAAAREPEADRRDRP